MMRVCEISRQLLVLAALSALLALALPGHASLAALPNNPCGSDNTNQMDQSFQSAFGAATQERAQAAQTIITSYGAKQIGACWSKIQQLFMMVGGLNSLVSVIFNAIAQQILQIVNQVCQFALSLTTQLTQYAKRELASLTCIPMPKLGLGLKNIGLTMPPPCNGVSLLGLGPMSPRTLFNWQQLIPQSTGGTPLGQ